MNSQQTRNMVTKALDVLDDISRHPQGVSVTEVARSTGLPLSTAHRLASTLAERNYVNFHEDSKLYTVGIHVFQLAQGVLKGRGLTELAEPILREISNVTQEATLLSVRNGNTMRYLSYVAGPKQVQVVGAPGSIGPLHCTSLGKVLVAFSADAVREELIETLPLDEYGPNTIQDRKKFREEIDRVTQTKFATADEEHEEGIRAISVPIMDGSIGIAGLSAAAPSYRASLQDLKDHLPFLHEKAREIAAVMAIH